LPLRRKNDQPVKPSSVGQWRHPGAQQRPEHGPDFREMAMNKKFMFVALGYLLLLAALGFALDASIVAMIV
jgi:hypothetical protein